MIKINLHHYLRHVPQDILPFLTIVGIRKFFNNIL